MNRFRAWLGRVMYGRYGQDQFGIFLMALAMVIFTVSLFTVPYVYIAAILIIGYEYFRLFSRNKAARYKENQWFLKNTAWVRKLFGKIRYSFTEGRNYKVFKCPKCEGQNRDKMPQMRRAIHQKELRHIYRSGKCLVISL